jgi:GT2 family glycosyltransferase
MMMAPLLVYVLNYNNHDDTSRCLASMLSSGGDRRDITLVDNGSTNDSSLRLSKEYGVGLMRTGRNLGYAGGMNLTMRAAMERGARKCLLSSTDVIYLPGALAALAHASGSTEFAVMAPVQVSDDGKEVRSAGKRMVLPRGEAWHETVVRGEAPYPVEAVDGAALLVDVERVLSVGGFDERYFMYWEDMDLSLRLAGAGWRVLVCPAARIVHKVSGTAGQDSPLQAYHSTRNRLLFLKAHAGAGQFLAANAYQSLYAMPVFLAHLLRTKQREALRAVIRGYVDGLVRPPGAGGVVGAGL